MNDPVEPEQAQEEIGNMRYRDAVAELEQILAEIESDEPDLDLLAERVGRAAALLRYCRGRIEATELSVRKVFDGMQIAKDEVSE